MDVSVVTPVRDDPQLLHALRSVPAGIEHVVTLTAAPPAVKSLVAEFRRTHRPDLIVREVERPGMSAGVNAGVDAASHEKIVMLDSDCTLSAGTLEAYCRALDRADFVRGVTRVRRGGFWSSFSGLGQEELNRVFSRGPARLIGPSIAFRKRPFLELGGYDLGIGGSCDHEFVLRMEDAGHATVFEPEAVIWHTALTFHIDVRSHFGYGRSMACIDRKRRGRYGLGICLDRWAPRTIWRKGRSRGAASVVRTLLLGGVMLAGYADRTLRPVPIQPPERRGA